MEKQEGEGEEAKMTMKPWEQHAAVINIPRFDYKAPSSLFRSSHSGFLITCTIKREKSATKEAMCLLEKHYGTCSARESVNNLGIPDGNVATKRRKVVTKEVDGEHVIGAQCERSTEASDKLPKGVCSETKADMRANESPALSLVKLTRSGLLLFTFPSENAQDTIRILSSIIESLEVGSERSPLWCHRIFPIQATCCLNEPELRSVVQKLVLNFLKDKESTPSQPTKFAVGYNRRGMEERELKRSKDSDGSDSVTLLDRNKCFEIVAAAVKDILSDAVVDLKKPELSVLVELLPLSALPSQSLVVAVSVLPPNLVATKPRLCVKALGPQNKPRNK